MTSPFGFAPPSDAAALRAAANKDLEQAKAIYAKLQQSPTSDAVLQLIDDFWKIRGTNGSNCSLMKNVHPDKAVRDEAEAIYSEWSQLSDDFNINRKVYEAVASIDIEKLGKIEKRWVERMIRDFKRNGVDKDEAFVEQVKALKAELTTLNQEFDRNINEDTRSIELPESVLDGMPEDYVKGHPANKDGKVTITTDYPDYFPFIKYCADGSARKAIMHASKSRAHPVNTDVIVKMFNKRNELATLLGYKSYADYKLETEMVKTGQNVQDFIDKIVGLAKPRADSDKDELLELKKRDEPNADRVEVWDSAYYGAILKKEKYAFDAQAARQYFPFGRVRDGILAATAKLFNVRFEKVDDAPVWHPDVVAYHLYDNDELAGRFFLDLHPRENKYKHAAEFDLRAGIPGQLPEASLVCNFPKGEDALMEHSEVTTFFHEFGHLLHHLFAKQRWVELAGITCDFDFVEAPSQMLEEWSYDRDTLKSFAKNAQGEAIPDDVVDGLRKSTVQGRGVNVCVQMAYAATSLHCHQPPPPHSGADLDAVYDRACSHYGPYPPVPDSHFVESFGHLGGYSTAYYCYMWSEVIAKDLFSRFKKHGLYDQTVAHEYKTKVLGSGGAIDTEEFVADFLGRPYSFDAFGEWLKEK